MPAKAVLDRIMMISRLLLECPSLRHQRKSVLLRPSTGHGHRPIKLLPYQVHDLAWQLARRELAFGHDFLQATSSKAALEHQLHDLGVQFQLALTRSKDLVFPQCVRSSATRRANFQG